MNLLNAWIWIALLMSLLMLVFGKYHLLVEARIADDIIFGIEIRKLYGIMGYKARYEGNRWCQKILLFHRYIKITAEKGEPVVPEARMEPEEKDKYGLYGIIRAVLSCRRSGTRLLSGLMHAFSMRKGIIEARFGAGDPAWTGMACGGLAVMEPFIPDCLQVTWYPEYFRKTFEGRACLEYQLLLGRLLLNAVLYGIPLYRRFRQIQKESGGNKTC